MQLFAGFSSPEKGRSAETYQKLNVLKMPGFYMLMEHP